MIMMKFFRAISLVIWFRFGGTNQKAESGLENGALTSINRGLGCPPYPHQINDREDEVRDGLRNVGP